MTEQRISVFCDEPSHNGRLVQIQAFTVQAAVRPEKTSPRLDRSTNNLVYGANHQYEEVILVGESVRDRVDAVAAAEVEEARLRWSLVCKVCGLDVTARQEKLGPILRALAENGVSTISLAAVARILA